MTISTDLFRQTMSLFPGAVTLVTVGQGDGRRGITATAVCSVTDTPPSLLVCVNRTTDTCSEITRLKSFSVQLLDHTSDDIALAFAGVAGLQGAQKFSVGAWEETDRGLPQLTTAVASVCCEVSSYNDVGSHRVFIGEIIDSALEVGDALIYARAQFGRAQATL
ncbi:MULTISPECIES: flavin reductase family protein [Pacificibacter]|uniref:flavin reductase family protein n=1 Tax=Pacificibacter TaxID=1042323 RepID=UPI001C07FABF|nr:MULTISPECIES: flavin reductase family protein [Pacificibacter]MBU2934729.1 flavin reductase family protein [Pacificibacter marinus]MDO6616829.1 flavin reductase family protein [Pacificibacter sp. 1_MG-2023]